MDPPKDDVAASIKQLQALGVEVKTLTGDSLGTALKTCQTLNLVPGVDEGNIQAITGPELARLDVQTVYRLWRLHYFPNRNRPHITCFFRAQNMHVTRKKSILD